MELILRYNYSAKISSWGSNELIEVVWQGRSRHVHFMGFIARRHARALSGAVSVRLVCHGWRLSQLDNWIYLDADKCVMGCMVDCGVYAVTQSDSLVFVDHSLGIG